MRAPILWNGQALQVRAYRLTFADVRVIMRRTFNVVFRGLRALVGLFEERPAFRRPLPCTVPSPAGGRTDAVEIAVDAELEQDRWRVGGSASPG